MKKHADGSEEISGKMYQGMFLPPEMVKEYNDADPEVLAKIIKWTEDEAKHRRTCERRFLLYNFIMNLSSHICSVLVAGGILYVAYLFMKDKYPQQGMYIALTIASVIGIFIIKKYIGGGQKTPNDNNTDKPMPKSGNNKR